jgi:hypothetical protein
MKPSLIPCFRVDKGGCCGSIGQSGILSTIKDFTLHQVVVSAENSGNQSRRKTREHLDEPRALGLKPKVKSYRAGMTLRRRESG